MEDNKHLFDECARLVPAAARGDAAAFNELYLLTRDACFFIALSITKNEEDALDILQDSYLKAYQRLAELKNPECFVRWLHQIVANAAKRFLSRSQRMIFSEGGEDSPLHWQTETNNEFLPEESLDMNETRLVIMEIIEDLPEDQRLCVLLHYYSNMELAEMAEALELPLGTVKSRLYYARNKISAAIKALESKGTKLYGAAPIALLIYCLREMSLPDYSQILPAALGGTVVAAGAASAGGAATAGATSAGSAAAASGGIAAKLGAIALPKIIAVAAAAAIAVGAPAAVLTIRHSQKNVHPPTTVTETYASTLNFAEDTVLPVILLPNETEAQIESTSEAFSALPTAFSAATGTAKTNTVNSIANTIAATSTQPQSGSTAQTTAGTMTMTTKAQPYSYTTRSTASTKPSQALAASETITATTTTTTSATTTTTTNPGANYQTAASGSGLRITGYTGPGGGVSVPASIDGKAVLEIGMGAFQSAGITSVTLPASVTAIGQFAFADCAALQSITIPASVTSIGMWAFDGCNAVTIRCAAGSAAHTYAVNNWIPFELI